MYKKLIALALLAAVILQGCAVDLPIGATATPTPSATPVPTATPLPTATPTPAPTPVPAARIEKGELALQAGDYDQALLEFQNAKSAAPDGETRAAALVGIGRVQILQNMPDAAISSLKEAIQTFPKPAQSANAQYFLAQAYIGMKNSPKAAEALAAYLDLKPGVLDAYIYEERGDLLAGMGNYEGAQAAYEAAASTGQLGDPTPVEIKAGKMILARADFKGAVRKFLAIYDATNNDYYKAQANSLAAQAYLNLGESEQAYARYQDSVANFPQAYDSYTGLVVLVNQFIAVDEFNRGLVDYYGGQCGYALEAFNRYLAKTPAHNGAAHHYKALCLVQAKQYPAAIAEWDALIKDHPSDKLWTTAWDEKAATLWYDLGKYQEAAQTLLDFVERVPDSPDAPANLYEAARILERSGQLSDAALTWESVMDKYPSSDWGLASLQLAGVTFFRMGQYEQAMTVFQRALVLGTTPEEQAAAGLWAGKTALAQGKPEAARNSWQDAAGRDPTGYYSERANELLQGLAPFQQKAIPVPPVDQAAERKLAEGWVRITFGLPPGTDLSGPGPLAGDARYQRGVAFWELGLYGEGRTEFEALRAALAGNAADSFRLLGEMLKMGFYRTAILTSRQILDLSGLDDAGTLLAPVYFNHIRFGTYFSQIVEAAAQAETFDPLLLFSVIRQESLFEGFASSGAGAQGLMQIMPDTGTEVAHSLGWPANFSPADLARPLVSIRLGARYLARQREAFDGNLFAALAAYNGGPGNAQAWSKLAGDDPDLFLEVVRIKETRDYIRQIYTFYYLYRRIYQNPLP